jgi:uroporphyrin-III C-methyltransferase / precorrin-2 dehydrogenase / sirohydrochlorin ferrochelatase
MTIASLPLFHTVARQPVIVLGTGDAAEAKRRLVERAGAQVIESIQEGIDLGARLAFVAHDNPKAQEGDAIRLRCAGLLVNVTDRPDLCDFVVPSILDRAPVLVAVGTGGASAGLAKALRLQLETLLPQRLGTLADALAKARGRLRARFPDVGERRLALDGALAAGGVLDPLDEASTDRVDGWLADAANARGDRLEEIRLQSADPDDLTLRQARLLGSADTLAHDPDVASSVLVRARADAVRIVLSPGEALPDRAGLTVILRT